jgi:NADH-quinone oxidoreductase subunit M
MFGKLDNPKNEGLADVNLRELATLVPLIIMAFWIGIYPAPFFRALDGPVNKLVEAVRPGYFDANPIEARVPDAATPVEQAPAAAVEARD